MSREAASPVKDLAGVCPEVSGDYTRTMELSALLLLALTTGFLLFLVRQCQPKTHDHFPPGPRPLPFLGNLLQMDRRGLLNSFMQVSHAQGKSPVGLALVCSRRSLSRKTKGPLPGCRLRWEGH